MTDGKGRDPFLCKLRKDNLEAKLRSIYFSEKYGLVFGVNDLSINFNNIE